VSVYLYTKISPVKKLLFAVLMMVVLVACNELNLYEKTVFFPKHEWDSKQQPSFNFDVEDTVSNYHIYIVIRHEDAFHYNNLWLNLQTKAPGTAVYTQKLNLVLANNANGWLGSGMDDIFDHRIRITKAPIHLKKGTYQFSIQQIMREDPLNYILNVGIRVEKEKS
jgi:gliding motility-associated lipoprotein GldH